MKNTDNSRAAGGADAVRIKKVSAVRRLTRAAIIGALYAALTLTLYTFSFGAIQFRAAEAMCVLPIFFPEAIPGLFVGCAIANIFTPNIAVLDIIFGSAATLTAALLTSKLKNASLMKRLFLAPLPPVLLNAAVIGAVITFSSVMPGQNFGEVYLYNALTVGGGEAAVCYILGVPLMLVIERIRGRIKTVAQ